MNDRIAFYNAICADPEDDAPRLVFADWLDEHGEPARAEFIRVQTALAHLTEADDEYWTLGDREQMLHCEHYEAWKAALPACLRYTFRFHRGFAQVARVASRAFLAESNQIAAGEPIGELCLAVSPRDWAALAKCPALGRIGNLALEHSEGKPDDWFAILASPHLAHLTRLSILGNLRPGDLQRLASWPGLARFRKLSLQGHGLQSTDLRLLADSPHVARLRVFHASHLAPEADGSCPVLSSPNFHSLERVVLSSSFDTRALLRFATTTLPSVRWFGLHTREPSIEAVSALARCPALSRLRHLGIDHCGFSAGVLRALVGPWLDNVAELSLVSNRMDADDVAYLAATDLPALRCLTLSGNRIGSAGVAHLARARWAPRLRLLDLTGCDIGAEGVRTLARAPLRSLRALHLEDNDLTDAGLAPLLEADWLGDLRVLWLANNRLRGDAFAMALAAFPRPLRLRTLTLDIDPDGDARRALRERFGEWVLRHLC